MSNPEIAKILLNALDLWGLTSSEQCAVLDLPEQCEVATFLHEDTWATNIALINRIGNLLVIYKILISLFSKNPELANAWIKTDNKAFSGRTPLEIITNEGLPGLIRIRAYLESSFD